jgi:CheY-like chemotaxis protein
MIKIFLAEDDVDDQELLAEAFHDIDPAIQLQSFTTGKEFLAHLDSLNDEDIPIMIIVDYNIPEINGADVLKHLEEQNRYNKVVKLVWSTANGPFYEESCMALGATAYLLKPSNIEALREVAKKMLTYIN